MRVNIAEELVQETALRCLEYSENAPTEVNQLRAWVFRIASNLGIDYLRLRGTFNESIMIDARKLAESNDDFMASTASLRGSPEMAFVAREHLSACFNCTLGQLSPEKAASLLLREIFGFSTQEIAVILQASFAQVKNWLQESRVEMDMRYAKSCALINKNGVCYQCVELDDFYQVNKGNPLEKTQSTLDDRMQIMRDLTTQPDGKWTQLLSNLLNDLT